jgi:dihydrodipicolinate synthase/N-acetylneuraminate lyase
MKVKPNQSQKTHHGVVVPMVTPITEKYELDESALRKVIDHLIGGGVQGIFVLGSTGEGPSVPRSMRSRVVHLTVDQVKGRARVYAGIIDNSALDMIAAAREYLKMGVSAVVAQLPNYYTLGADEQFRYFTSLIERIQGPILLYEIPATVHMSLDLSVIEHLRAFSNVVGIKDSSGKTERVEALLDSYSDDPGFSVLVGTSGLYSYGLRHGADGIVPGGANLEPGLCARIYTSALTGDWSLMGDLQRELDRISADFLVPGYLGQTIARIKWQMSQRGLCGPTVFPPLQTVIGPERT